ncbi:MAG: hypothetical protein IT373_01180 [Polyangiaceae bacterium]|nr:hypothetical protein [Polyangiaceae bacterium]
MSRPDRAPARASVRRVVWLALTVALGLVGASCGQERLRPGFPHNLHLTTKKCGEEGGMPCPTCSSCHTDMQRAGGAKPPGEAECAACHKATAKEELAKVAHGPGHANITFPHDRHLPMPEIAGQCVRCHKGVPDDGTVGAMFPPMAACLGCHSGAFETATCSPCHQRADLVKLEPQTVLRHDSAFLRNHGEAATRNQNVCSQCHAVESCTSCHDDTQTLDLGVRRIDKLDRPQHHRGDFVARHTIEAAASPATCTRCHQPTFCEGCHTARGVSAGARDAVNPHPFGWVTDVTSANFHGRGARRDILSCAACHDQGPATNCIRCHQVGGSGGNPHPSGWKTGRSTGETMCGYCHGP